jgi:hypothetical protein
VGKGFAFIPNLKAWGLPAAPSPLRKLKYFASDFNKFLHSLSKEMTVMNIDTIIFKKSKKNLKIIEYKHSKEEVSDEEYRVYDLFRLFLCQNNSSVYDYKIGVYIVRGESPFDTIHVTKLSLPFNETKIFNGDEIKKWCEFEIDF